MKKRISMLLACAMMLALVSCGGGNSSTPANSTPAGSTPAGSTSQDDATPTYHIGIITGTVSQSEDDLRGAEAIQAKYGAGIPTRAVPCPVKS